MGGARARVADFWDSYFVRWLALDDPDDDPLPQWKASYDGQIDAAFSADPFSGDLRGDTIPPRLVMLGLNPGMAYPALQGRDPRGTWMERVATVGYSRCFDRIPYEDEAWRAHHKDKDSRYWVRVVNFARRWTGDDQLRPQQILNMELYPWHSNRIAGAMNPPGEIIDRFVWQPIAEVDTPTVFAFGAPWRTMCQNLTLPLLAAFEPADLGDANGNWNVHIYALRSGQRVVVSWQQGSAGPPGPNRLAEFRRVVDS